MSLLMLGIGLLIAIQLFVIIGLDANDDTELPSIVVNTVPSEERAEVPPMEEHVHDEVPEHMHDEVPEHMHDEVPEHVHDEVPEHEHEVVVSNVPNNKFSEIE